MKCKSYKGMFISIEGTDGCGKSTQIPLIKEYLEKNGHDIVVVREPGGTAISEKIRNILLDKDNTGMFTKTEILLYAAARAQIVEEVILPALEAGKTIICDRFVDSSYAYQGFGRDSDLEEIIGLNEFATSQIMPDITFFMDISPELAFERRMAAAAADRIESEGLSFQVSVYAGFHALAKRFPERIKVIDATQDVDSVFSHIKEYIILLGGQKS
jgi:dTMP kinase